VIGRLTGGSISRLKENLLNFSPNFGLLETLITAGWSHEPAKIITAYISPLKAKTDDDDEGF